MRLKKKMMSEFFQALMTYLESPAGQAMVAGILAKLVKMVNDSEPPSGAAQ